MLKGLFSKTQTTAPTDTKPAADALFIKHVSYLREKLETELSCCAYYYDNSKFIICKIASIMEYGEPIVLPHDVDNLTLGKTVYEAVLGFKLLDDREQISHSLTDWEAFKASGEKTVKAFEQKSTYLNINTHNEALKISARPKVTNDRCLSAVYSASIRNLEVEVGVALKKAIKASEALRTAGLQ